MERNVAYVKKLSLAIVFSALGVVLSSFSWFEFLGTKAYPSQHMINAILGVLAGPLWAVAAAATIGITRNVLGTGTFYAFPGGIPGGIVVGVVYWLLKRVKVGEKSRLTSALAEPLGTILIGASLSLFLIAPWAGTKSLLDLTADKGVFLGFLVFSSGWALSCILGSIIGFTVLLILFRLGISRKTLFGEG